MLKTFRNISIQKKIFFFFKSESSSALRGKAFNMENPASISKQLLFS